MSKKNKPTKKDQALEEYISYLKDNGKVKKSFDDKLELMINESFEEINQYSALELIEKCGKGPSTGYVDGVQYKKDYQRVTDGKAKVGELEQKHLDKQMSDTKLHKGDKPFSQRSATEREIEKCLDYPEDMIGMSLHEDYETPNIEEDYDEYGYIGGWTGGMESDTGAYWDELEDAYGNFSSIMNKAPTLDDNVMLFTHDVPNPELQEGDVFELDTFLGVNFKKGMVGQYDDMWDDVDIPYLRSTNSPMSEASYFATKNKPYDVTVLGSEGTPLLMEEPFRRGGHINVHEGILNKGQKVRLVRVNHDKRTAIYQTVDE